MKITSITTAKNAALTIGRTLQSLSFAHERLVIVDTSSTDNTAQIAKEAGAIVLTRDWPGFGAQKNFAADMAQGDWLLYVDSDEEIPPQLRKQIVEATQEPTHDFYWLRIVTVFLNKPLNHLYGHNPRLMRKGKGQWTDAKVHEQLKTNDGTIIRLGDDQSDLLNEPLMHHSHTTIQSYLDKMHSYTTLDAEQMSQTGQHRSGKKVSKSWWLPFYLASKQFIKLYIYRRGLLDGFAGLTWSFLSAYYEFEMGQKYIHTTQL